MKLTTIENVEKFIETCNACKAGVRLTSQYGDQYNLKSVLTQYVAIGKLIEEHNNELELFCDSKEDEAMFLKLFQKNPEMV